MFFFQLERFLFVEVGWTDGISMDFSAFGRRGTQGFFLGVSFVGGFFFSVGRQWLGLVILGRSLVKRQWRIGRWEGRYRSFRVQFYSRGYEMTLFGICRAVVGDLCFYVFLVYFQVYRNQEGYVQLFYIYIQVLVWGERILGL